MPAGQPPWRGANEMAAPNSLWGGGIAEEEMRYPGVQREE